MKCAIYYWFGLIPKCHGISFSSLDINRLLQDEGVLRMKLSLRWQDRATERAQVPGDILSFLFSDIIVADPQIGSDFRCCGINHPHSMKCQIMDLQEIAL